MVSKEELHVTFSALSTEKLMEIIDNKFGFTELAITVAFEELSSRKVTEEEVRNYKFKQLKKLNTYIKNNVWAALNISQKNLFYFIWLPIFTIIFKENFRQEGFTLKVRQANYYSLAGFLAFIVIALLFNRVSNITLIAIWIGGFIPAYAFDDFFNRQSQIKKLQKIFSSNVVAEPAQEQAMEYRTTE
jgi:hypothetical protein